MKRLLHKTALRVECLLDRLQRRSAKTRIIDPYLGYATTEQLIVRGRVLSRSTASTPSDGQGVLTNLRQMLRLFLTDELADIEVSAGGVKALTDEEGYFTLVLPRPEAPGWHDVSVNLTGVEAPEICPALVPAPNARCLIISDIDDTVLKTGAYSLLRNLWTSLTGNALTRQIFPDAVAMMRELSEEGRNPVFYVSSSPWNLHGFLISIFDAFNLVRGPMFLRDLGISETQFITGTHGDHKGVSIDTLLAAMPDLPVLLIGYTGQHDAEVYRDAIARHPGRIVGVILREPGPGPKPDVHAVMDEIRATGVPLLNGADFTGMAPLALLD